MAVLYYVLKRLGNGVHAGRNERQLQLLESHSLGNRQRLVLVRAKDREILLGITLQQISPLATWPATETQGSESIDSTATSADMKVNSSATLRRLMDRFQRSEARKP